MIHCGSDKAPIEHVVSLPDVPGEGIIIHNIAITAVASPKSGSSRIVVSIPVTSSVEIKQRTHSRRICDVVLERAVGHHKTASTSLGAVPPTAHRRETAMPKGITLEGAVSHAAEPLNAGIPTVLHYVVVESYIAQWRCGWRVNCNRIINIWYVNSIKKIVRPTE